MARGKVAVADVLAQSADAETLTRPTQHTEEPLLHSARTSLADDDSDLDVELADLEDATDTARLVASSQPSLSRPPAPVSRLTIALVLTLVVLGQTISTEATAYFEDTLGWRKPFMTMYLLHSSLGLPWVIQILYLRLRARHVPYTTWVAQYNDSIRTTVSTISAYATDRPRLVYKFQGRVGGPLDYLATVMAICTVALSISGASWFLSLSLTTPADLTAIGNSATFFAAAFSVPLLKEKLSREAILAIVLSTIGTVTIAYGDTSSSTETDDDATTKIGTSRLAGNLVAVVGSVAFGLYEVLLKKWASPAPSAAAAQGPHATFNLSLASSALTGFYTGATLWVGLLALHILGIETIEVPEWRTAGWVVLAAGSGAGQWSFLLTHGKSKNANVLV